MLENEVNYRLAKWLLLNMKQDGVISSKELKMAWTRIAKRYNPPFLDVEDFKGTIGDGVTVDGR